MTDIFYPRSGEWATVASALSAHTVAELGLLAEVAGAAAVGRKDDRIATLCSLLEGERLRFSFGRLTRSQQAAVSMATYSHDGRLSREGFEIRYGEEPDFGAWSRTWQGLERPSLLCLFIHGDRIPKDLLFRLRGFVSPPPDVSIRTLAAPPDDVEVRLPGRWSEPETFHRRKVHTVERSEAALAELEEVLRLVAARAVALTPKKRQPTPESLQKLKRALANEKDFLDEVSSLPVKELWGESEQPEIRTVAWPRLLVLGGLARLRGTRLVLTEEGARVARAPTAEAIRDLWTAWLATNDADELFRISGIRGARSKDAELTEPSVRRRLVAAALSDCPAGSWVATDAFFDHVQVSGRDFEVTRNAAALRIESYSGRGGLDAWARADRWRFLQGRFVMCLLFEYAATLGLVDVAYIAPSHARDELRDGPFLSRYDGLQAFRVTRLGAYALSQSAEAPPLARPRKGHLVLADGLEIRTTGSLFAAERDLLESIAEPLGEGAWRLSRTRVLTMLARGGRLRSVRERLGRSLGGPLPPQVTVFFKDCERRARSVKRVGSGRLLECRDPSLADALASHPKTSRYCHRAGDRLLVVPLDHESEFNRALLEAGFGAVGPR